MWTKWKVKLDQSLSLPCIPMFVLSCWNINKKIKKCLFLIEEESTWVKDTCVLSAHPPDPLNQRGTRFKVETNPTYMCIPSPSSALYFLLVSHPFIPGCHLLISTPELAVIPFPSSPCLSQVPATGIWKIAKYPHFTISGHNLLSHLLLLLMWDYRTDSLW